MIHVRPRRTVAAGLLLIAAAAPGAAHADRDAANRDAEVVRPTTDFSKPETYENYPAGAATSFKLVNADAFSQSSANMKFERELNFKVGNGFFRRFWVSAPASTTHADGLGPLFNSRACQSCHLKDGRGHPPLAGAPHDDNSASMFVRLSIPPETAEQRAALASGKIAVVPEPTYGGQFQDFAIQGHRAEGRMTISYREMPVTMAGGEIASLRAPTYGVTDLGYGPLHPKTMLSPRVTPQMIGLGFLEAIAEADILAGEDPDDRDMDGISGRANRVWSGVMGRVALGRFGWKAGNATIEDQAAGAFSGDIGISTTHFPDPGGDCTERQTACRAAPNGNDADEGNVEAGKTVLDLVVFYSRNLAVPARRDLGAPQVLAGKEAFYEAGCIGCHRPKFITPRDIPGMPEQSRQLIWPYTDLLLHDMGDGLADNRPEGLADGREWRTPPLWGIGLTKTVSEHTFFLHDGRARNLTEAILWHGGEAEAAKERFRALPKAERDALLAFLDSL